MQHIRLTATILLLLSLNFIKVNGQVNSISAENLSEFKIAGNLYLKFPSNSLAEGYNPEWEFINNYLFEVPIFAEFFYNNMGSFKTKEGVRLTEKDGKAVFIYSGDGGVADIEIPEGKVLLSSVPQTFALKNFRSNKTPSQEQNYVGSITLSVNNKGTITASFKKELYSAQKKLLVRTTSEVFSSPIMPKPSLALIRKNNAKYNSKYINILENSMLEFIKLYRSYIYVPHTITNVIEITKDANGLPTYVKIDYQTIPEGGGTDNTDRKAEILLQNGIPIGIIDDATGELGCSRLSKIVDGKVSKYSDLEIDEITELQLKFLFKRMIEKQKQKNYNSKYSCLKVYNVYINSSHEETRSFFNDKVKVANERLDHQEWLNDCSETVVIRGVSFDIQPISVKISDISFSVKPNEYVPTVKITKNVKAEDLLNTQTFLGIGELYY